MYINFSNIKKKKILNFFCFFLPKSIFLFKKYK